jgi:N-acyl-L-homoserine lactone synthetase
MTRTPPSTLLALDTRVVLRASARFLPTDGPHLLADVFPHFTINGPPRGPTIMEWTRHAPGDPAWPPGINDAARTSLHLGVLEFAALRGVTAFTAVMETWLVRRAQAMGWPCTPLGPARSYGEGMAVAVLNAVAPDHLERLRASSGRRDPVLVLDTPVAA